MIEMCDVAGRITSLAGGTAPISPVAAATWVAATAQLEHVDCVLGSYAVGVADDHHRGGEDAAIASSLMCWSSWLRTRILAT